MGGFDKIFLPATRRNESERGSTEHRHVEQTWSGFYSISLTERRICRPPRILARGEALWPKPLQNLRGFVMAPRSTAASEELAPLTHWGAICWSHVDVIIIFIKNNNEPPKQKKRGTKTTTQKLKQNKPIKTYEKTINNTEKGRQ